MRFAVLDRTHQEKMRRSASSDMGHTGKAWGSPPMFLGEATSLLEYCFNDPRGTKGTS
jgi:hypothetical protein